MKLSEGKEEEKKHQRMGILDLKKFAEAKREIFEKELLSIIKETDIGNPCARAVKIFVRRNGLEPFWVLIPTGPPTAPRGFQCFEI